VSVRWRCLTCFPHIRFAPSPVALMPGHAKQWLRSQRVVWLAWNSWFSVVDRRAPACAPAASITSGSRYWPPRRLSQCRNSDRSPSKCHRDRGVRPRSAPMRLFPTNPRAIGWTTAWAECHELDCVANVCWPGRSRREHAAHSNSIGTSTFINRLSFLTRRDAWA
jgi:hypothetical protein